MRKVFFLLFIFIAGFLTSSFLTAESPEKIYVSSSEIILKEEGVFFLDRDSIIPVSQIGFDEEGLYVCPEISLLESPQMWICRMCGYDNDFWRQRCVDCQHLRQ